MPDISPQNPVSVRTASFDDLENIVDLHVSVWRDTYKPYAPAAALKALDHNNRRAAWAQTLGAPMPDYHTFVALRAGDIIGLVCMAPAHHAAFETGRDTAMACAEIKHLYVDPHHGRLGVGSRLMSVAFDTMRAAGYGHIALAVVHENIPAQTFYRSIGGVQSGTFVDPGPLWKSNNLIYKWALKSPPNTAH